MTQAQKQKIKIIKKPKPVKMRIEDELKPYGVCKLTGNNGFLFFRRRYADLESAEAEAARLFDQLGGRSFFTVKIVGAIFRPESKTLAKLQSEERK